MCRRLRKVLLLFKILFCQDGLFIQSFEQDIVLCLFFIRLYINGTESVKCDFGCCNGKPVIARVNLDGSRLKSRRLHLARRKAFPDQLIQAELVSRKRLFERSRCSGNIRRTDCLVGILNIFSPVLFLFCVRYIFCTVNRGDIFSRKTLRFLGNTGGIRTEIGNDTNRSLTLDINSFI